MVVVTKESALARPSLPLFCLLLHPNLVWVSVFFLSACKASGEKIGSFGSVASSLTSKLRKVAEKKLHADTILLQSKKAVCCLQDGGFLLS